MKKFNNNIVVLYSAFLFFFPGSIFAVDIFEDEDVIWQTGKNVFIKYAEQDDSHFGNNDHPVDLRVEEISKVLASLIIAQKDRAAPVEQQKVLFTNEQSDILSRNFANGLAKAQPNQDIIFALEKRVRKFFGIRPQRLFVAGRAFYKDEKLNIIIGDYDRPGDEAFEAAYDPTHVGIVPYDFGHGRRTRNSRTFKDTSIVAEGVENKQLDGTRRNDWLVIDLKLASEAIDLTASKQKAEERARKREELKDLLDSEETNPKESAMAAPAAPPTATPASATKSIAERLTTLEELREKGLITDEEFATKRRQILDDL